MDDEPERDRLPLGRAGTRRCRVPVFGSDAGPAGVTARSNRQKSEQDRAT
ncbi:hypothetical protein [Streptomyces sp. NPDC001717]